MQYYYAHPSYLNAHDKEFQKSNDIAFFLAKTDKDYNPNPNQFPKFKPPSQICDL